MERTGVTGDQLCFVSHPDSIVDRAGALSIDPGDNRADQRWSTYEPKHQSGHTKELGSEDS